MTDHDDRFKANRRTGRVTSDSPQRRRTDQPKASPNPPHTTQNGVTAPKFGSAGSGGAELEPGVDKN